MLRANMNKNRYEIIIYGRGGQGVKTAAELIVQTAISDGKFVQAFPEFGPERSGAPVKAFVRISDEPIKTHQTVENPNCILVLDDTLLDWIDVTKNLDEKEPLIINTKEDKDKVAEKVKKESNLITVDASGMSKEIIGEDRPNTVILGKFAFVTEKVDIEKLTEVFRQKYSEKIGEERTEKNIEAIKRAYGP